MDWCDDRNCSYKHIGTTKVVQTAASDRDCPCNRRRRWRIFCGIQRAVWGTTGQDGGRIIRSGHARRCFPRNRANPRYARAGVAQSTPQVPQPDRGSKAPHRRSANTAATDRRCHEQLSTGPGPDRFRGPASTPPPTVTIIEANSGCYRTGARKGPVGHGIRPELRRDVLAIIADILLMAGALGAGLYCYVLARRLARFNDLESGVGGAVAVLSAQVDDLTRALTSAQATAGVSAQSLDQLTERAETAARRLELMVAALHDLPDSGATEADVPTREPMFVRHGQE